ncbi:MAG: nickel pincer cofactor biosynthesis protein LarB [Clostridia bacterium]|nr:nickel pincer cofactor biosynthesis protein LarB [Clostridia bacterium]MDO5302900.1 nickel pincer cofactor biosynthesis protein LarB [Clostridia bacterium]
MEQQEIRDLLQQVKEGAVSTEEVLMRLKLEPFEDIDIAKIDNHRGLRQGASEIIYGASKTPEQIDVIARKMYEGGQRTILITRMSREAAEYIDKDLPFTYYADAKVGLVGQMIEPRQKGYILVATGGTSDIPVAEEAALTAEILGNNVKRVYDVGVAGIHRLLAHTEDIMNARVIIAIAGMEGALASVIGGLADCPVIAVPTSVGYGTALGGVTALLSMLNSCASGVSVVNIDNGFGAGYQAHLINNMEG